MKKLTHPQYLQLLGLLALAAEHVAQLAAIQGAAEKITGEKDGHTRDVVWSGETPQGAAEYLLTQLKLGHDG
ncbi:hypothetical protein EON80_32535 [bacterium]|nr:MAG: hypothetical protein EON80_32535 [bacterium]